MAVDPADLRRTKVEPALAMVPTPRCQPVQCYCCIGEHPCTWAAPFPRPCPSLAPHCPLIHRFQSFLLVSRHHCPPSRPKEGTTQPSLPTVGSRRVARSTCPHGPTPGGLPGQPVTHRQPAESRPPPCACTWTSGPAPSGGSSTGAGLSCHCKAEGRRAQEEWIPHRGQDGTPSTPPLPPPPRPSQAWLPGPQASEDCWWPLPSETGMKSGA